MESNVPIVIKSMASDPADFEAILRLDVMPVWAESKDQSSAPFLPSSSLRVEKLYSFHSPKLETIRRSGMESWL